MPKSRTEMIANYIAAYNNFDVDSMLMDLHPDIEFVNMTNGVKNLSLKGIESFRMQALQALNYFETRLQQIKAITLQDDRAEVDIFYRGRLKIDLPSGLKKGDEIELEGKSIFHFEDDKIVGLTDIS